MYFKNRNSIDDEFNNYSLFSKVLSYLNKYKIIVIVVLLIILFVSLIIFMLNGNISADEDDIVVKDIVNYLELYGDDIITIYENSDYIESGYRAYNSIDEDLTKNVKVISNLNNNIVGEYEITYMLGDIVKTRIVNVVEKPRVYTFIRLNTVDGSVDIRLKKGDVYQEPGYNVFSTSGVELNDKVVVSGDVDTSKNGIYELVYSLVDEYGIIISVSRKVTVIDLEINYSLNPTSYTSDDVVINISVDDNLFEYMILPDNTKVYSSKYSYKVTNNGNYLFKVYGIMGMVKEKTIEVKNIDRDGPSGSCVVDHNTNGSFITISVNDVSGIKKYEYNGSYYSNEKINLNDYISSAIVTVYDKLDNSSKLNCKVLELKEELLVDKSHYTNLKNVNYVKTARLDVSNVGCNVTYGTGNVIKSMTFHELLIDDLSGIFKNICKYINKTSWINELQSAGAYVNKGDSYHAKGMAVDLNNQWSYAVNGKTYKPYSGQGTNTWYNYNKFVCEVCDGKEDCKYNVNYIIYKRYFEGNGWCWGGNWGTGAFDPMHYEIRPDNKCVNARKQKITCN